MKILVLGNGFDVDHDLPTSYKNFLDFCNYVNQMDVDDSLATDKLTPTQIKYIDILKNNRQIKDTFTTFIKDNPFINYFTVQYENQGNNWIDFEREIKNIIKEFRLLELKLSESSRYNIETGRYHIVHDILDNLNMSDSDNVYWDTYSLDSIHKIFCKALNDIALALEYYITIFINNTEVSSISPDIIDFDADRILSFNYSDTYERVYGGVHWGEEIDHVHGIAVGDNFERASIILGITSNDNNAQGSYVEFEKYYQRITQKTGNKYKKWLTYRTKNDSTIEVMFFGHSLDSSDSDIIRDLICNSKTKIKIVYHSQSSFNDIVANLIEILGKEELITAVSGNDPKIIFTPQKKSENDNTAGIEIERDVRALYKLYSLSNDEIDSLLEKIHLKIKQKDLSYFYSQEKSIDLFEGLRYISVRKYDVQTFFEICNKLDYKVSKNGKLFYYDYERWFGTNFSGDLLPCDNDTISLVKLVNESNEKRINKIEKDKILTSFQNMKTCDEFKNALLDILSNPNPTQQYWNDLYELMRMMVDNTLFSKALDLLKKESLSIPILTKLNHLEYEYNEYCDRVDYERQMADPYAQ